MKTLLVALVLIIPCLLYAEIYKWTDDRGIVHFTEDPSTIPEQYRDSAQQRLTEEDSMSKEEKIKAKERSEEEAKERLERENKAYQESLEEEKSRKAQKEREYGQYEEKIRAEKDERSRKVKGSGSEPKPEYTQIQCSRCNGSGIIWKKTKTLKTVGKVTYYEEGPQVATKCEDCNGKGFTLKRVQ